MAIKTLKNPYRLLKVMLKFPRRGKKPKHEMEKPKVTYSVALVMAFLAA